MVRVLFPCVLDSKVINDKRKHEFGRVVEPEVSCVWYWCISISVQVLGQTIAGYSFGLFESCNYPPDFHLGVAIWGH